MPKTTRYEVGLCACCRKPKFTEHPVGGWVKHEDHHTEVRHLKATIARQNEALAEIRREYNELQREAGGDKAGGGE